MNLEIVNYGTYGQIYKDANCYIKNVKILEYISQNEINLYSNTQIDSKILDSKLSELVQNEKLERSEPYLKTQLKTHNIKYISNLYLIYPNLKEICFLS